MERKSFHPKWCSTSAHGKHAWTCPETRLCSRNHCRLQHAHRWKNTHNREERQIMIKTVNVSKGLNCHIYNNKKRSLTWRKATVQGIVLVNTSQSSNESCMIVGDTWKCVTSTTKKLWYSNGKHMVVWYSAGIPFLVRSHAGYLHDDNNRVLFAGGSHKCTWYLHVFKNAKHGNKHAKRLLSQSQSLKQQFFRATVCLTSTFPLRPRSAWLRALAPHASSHDRQTNAGHISRQHLYTPLLYHHLNCQTQTSAKTRMNRSLLWVMCQQCVRTSKGSPNNGNKTQQNTRLRVSRRARDDLISVNLARDLRLVISGFIPRANLQQLARARAFA